MRMRRHWRAYRLLTFGILALLIAPEPTSARTEGNAKATGPARTAHQGGQNTAKPAPPPWPILAVVSLAKQRISVYASSGLIMHGPVSSGQPGFRTPTGVFTILQKSRYHRSNIYSDAPMPFMQRITWSGVALHAGVLPGYPASHGCIRLTYAFATQLWGTTKLNARVVVTPEDLSPVEVRHAGLPVPTLTPAPATTANVGAGEEKRTELVSLANDTNSRVAEETTPDAVKLLNPLDRAKAEKIRTAADAAAKAKAAKEAARVSAAKAAEANKAITALRDAEAAVATARARLEMAAKEVEAANSPEAVERARAMQAAGEAKVEEMSKAVERAATLEAAKTPEAFAAARAAWDAEKASEAATLAAKAFEKATEPISIFASKKTGRVYIRQGWAPIHEAAVTFKEPEAPLGTHLFVAMEPQDAGKTMRWLSVSMPPSLRVDERQRAAKRGQSHVTAMAQTGPRPRDTPASALERLEMSGETRAFISDRLWTGASLVISDQGISDETGAYTDFIVLTR
jgi:hypothetical protein